MSKQEETQNGVRDANREIRRVLADEFPSIDFSCGDDDPPARVRGIITAALPPSSGGAAKRVYETPWHQSNGRTANVTLRLRLQHSDNWRERSVRWV